MLRCRSGVRDGKNSDPGWTTRNRGFRDKHPRSATLVEILTRNTELSFKLLFLTQEAAGGAGEAAEAAAGQRLRRRPSGPATATPARTRRRTARRRRTSPQARTVRRSRWREWAGRRRPPLSRRWAPAAGPPEIAAGARTTRSLRRAMMCSTICLATEGFYLVNKKIILDSWKRTKNVFHTTSLRISGFIVV